MFCNSGTKSLFVIDFCFVSLIAALQTIIPLFQLPDKHRSGININIQMAGSE